MWVSGMACLHSIGRAAAFGLECSAQHTHSRFWSGHLVTLIAPSPHHTLTRQGGKVGQMFSKVNHLLNAQQSQQALKKKRKKTVPQEVSAPLVICS